MEKGGTFGHRRVLVLILVVASSMVLVLQSAGPCAGKVSGGSAKQSSPSSNNLVTPSSDYCNTSVTSTFTVVDSAKGTAASVPTQPVFMFLWPSLAACKSFISDSKYRQLEFSRGGLLNKKFVGGENYGKETHGRLPMRLQFRYPAR
jgi:hypothetical protein